MGCSRVPILCEKFVQQFYIIIMYHEFNVSCMTQMQHVAKILFEIPFPISHHNYIQPWIELTCLAKGGLLLVSSL